MPRIVFAIFIASAIIVSCLPSYAAGEDLLEGMNKKLTRGAIDVVTAGLEVPSEIVRRSEEGSRPFGAIAGIWSGLGRFVGRTASGLCDLMMFWSLDPLDNINVGIPINNEYSWEPEEEPYDLFNPNFAESAISPVVTKGVRGVSNLFCGIAEIPGQIKKGAAEGSTGLGVARGLWSWLSREAWGMRDIVTMFLPTPNENVGPAFEEEWPWDALYEPKGS
jgi:hypothetical protein